MALPRLPDIKCPQCGVSFRPYRRNRKYCSQKCMWAAQTKLPKRKCNNCGKEFQPRNSRHVSCSVPCRQAMHRKKKCVHCGTLFRPNCKKQRFCSQKCYHMTRRHGPTSKYEFTYLKCSGCGCVFCLDNFTYASRQHHKRFFCTKDCYEKNGRKKRDG